MNSENNAAAETRDERMDGIMLIFIGLIIEIGASVLGFWGAGGVTSGIGGFIGLAGIVVELIGFLKVATINVHFARAKYLYIASLICTGAFAIIVVIMSAAAIATIFYGGTGLLIGVSVVSLISAIVLGVLDILRIRELMAGCAQIGRENGSDVHAEKCLFASKLYMISRALVIAVSVILLIITIASYNSLLGGGYGVYRAVGGIVGALLAFGIILICLRVFMIVAQILVIIRTYRTMNDFRNAKLGNVNVTAGEAFSGMKEEFAKGAGGSTNTEKKNESGVKSNGVAAGVSASAVAGGSVADAKKTGSSNKDVVGKKESSGKTIADDDQVTMLMRPDVELEYIYKDTKKNADDIEKTVLLSGTASKVVLTKVSNGEKIEIERAPFILGRSREKTDHRIDSPSVSSVHAKVLMSEEGIFIEDMNSSNHTYINGKMIEADDTGISIGLLSNNDTLKLAEEEFKVEIIPEKKETDKSAEKGGYFIVEDARNGEKKEIKKNTFSLGRDRGDADLKIADKNTVGRVHARIRLENSTEDVFIKDEDSANGTFINGEKLAKGEERKIDSGDEIKLSDVVIRFRKTREE